MGCRPAGPRRSAAGVSPGSPAARRAFAAVLACAAWVLVLPGTAAAASSLSLTAMASPSTVTGAGQTISYSYAVINTGNTVLTGVSITTTLFFGGRHPRGRHLLELDTGPRRQHHLHRDLHHRPGRHRRRLGQ